MQVEIITLNHKVVVPQYATDGSAAFDLCASLDDDFIMGPGYVHKFSTGLKVWLKDPSIAMQIIPRSSTGVKGLLLANGTGLIDSDYQGPLMVPLWNRTDHEITIKPGERIAQAIITPVVKVQFKQVEVFSGSTARGEGGFGSTGR